MSNITLDEENPLQMFLYALRAPESKRQYPKRLKVVLDYLKNKGELRTAILEHQCREFIMKTRENPKWANNQLMQLVLYQKGREESGVYTSPEAFRLALSSVAHSRTEIIYFLVSFGYLLKNPYLSRLDWK